MSAFFLFLYYFAYQQIYDTYKTLSYHPQVLRKCMQQIDEGIEGNLKHMQQALS